MVEQPPEEDDREVNKEGVEEEAGGRTELRQTFIYPAEVLLEFGIDHVKDLFLLRLGYLWAL